MDTSFAFVRNISYVNYRSNNALNLIASYHANCNRKILKIANKFQSQADLRERKLTGYFVYLKTLIVNDPKKRVACQ